MGSEMLGVLAKRGVSVWLDSLSRDMLHSGFLKDLIGKGLRGQTSNPTIFQGAVGKSKTYNDDVLALSQAGKSAEDICWELMIADVQAACEMFLPVYEQTQKLDGYVSLELDPTKANDTAGSLQQGMELWPRVNRPNLMIKVPATREGIPVILGLLEAGFNVNVTLLFSVERYEEVILTHMTALENRAAKGLPIDGVASVASFFVSRVDTEAEKRFAKMDPAVVGGFQGTIALANAKEAYARFLFHLNSPRGQALLAKGAQVQRPLWASTGTKNPKLSDCLYVDNLIGPHCVNTMPEATLTAVLDHGKSLPTLDAVHLAESKQVLAKLEAAGVSLKDITQVLETEGVQKFIDSYKDLLQTIQQSVQTLKVG